MSLSPTARVSCVLLSSAALTLGAVGTATAAEEPSPPEEGMEVEWPPADTGGEWLPVPGFAYEPFDVAA